MELVGLCHSTVSWLAKLHGQGVYPYSGARLPSSEDQGGCGLRSVPADC